MVVGTTGHTEVERAELRKISEQIPMVWSSNFSTGVNALFWLTRKTAEILGPEYDMEIVENASSSEKGRSQRHGAKPGRNPGRSAKQQLHEIVRHGREGMVGERSAVEIGMHSVRGGDVVGDHTVIFATTGERLELTHKASSRETFAAGALRAAQWVTTQKPGLYDMQDVLGL